MVAQPNRAWISVEDYLTLDRTSLDARYEYIDDYPYLRAGGTAQHSIISANLTRELGNLLRRGPCRVYTSDMKVRLSRTRYVYPDISVSCDAHDLVEGVSLWMPR